MPEPDLAKIAELGINYIVSNPDPKTGYIPYFGAKVPLHGLPYIERTPWDFADQTGRMMEAAQYARLVTRSERGLDVERGTWNAMLGYFEEDGLPYTPDTPWSQHSVHGIWPGTALALKCHLTGDKRSRELLEKLVGAVDRISEFKDGYRQIWGVYAGGKWIDKTVQHAAFYCNAMLWAGKLAGMERAFDLGKELVRSSLDGPFQVLDLDGNFLETGLSKKDEDQLTSGKFQTLDYSEMAEVGKAWLVVSGHVHTRTLSLQNILMVGLETGQREYVECAKKGIDIILEQCGSSFGWIAENLYTAGIESSEMCCLVDTLLLLVSLAENGYPEYWGTIERFVRNHLVKSQFVLDDAMREVMKENLKETPPTVTDDSRTYRDVLERIEGGYAGPIYANDIFSYYPSSRSNPNAKKLIDVSGCCSPSGIKAVCFAYDAIASLKNGDCTINLSLTRDDDDISIRSTRDDDGTIEIQSKRDLNVRYRLPDWINAETVTLSVDGKERETDISEDGMLEIGSLSGGQKAAVSMAVPEKTSRENVGRVDHEIQWRGDTIVGMEGGDDPSYRLYG